MTMFHVKQSVLVGCNVSLGVNPSEGERSGFSAENPPSEGVDARRDKYAYISQKTNVFWAAFAASILTWMIIWELAGDL